METFQEHVAKHQAWTDAKPKHPGFLIEGAAGQWIKGEVVGQSLVIKDSTGKETQPLSLTAVKQLRDQLAAFCPPEANTPKD